MHLAYDEEIKHKIMVEGPSASPFYLSYTTPHLVTSSTKKNGIQEFKLQESPRDSSSPFTTPNKNVRSASILSATKFTEIRLFLSSSRKLEICTLLEGALEGNIDDVRAALRNKASIDCTDEVCMFVA